MQTLAAPLIVGGGMFTLGACLKFIPSKLWRQLEDIAQANDLNLMEDYRKSQVLSHLDLLWDKVFAYEARLRYSPKAQQEEHDEILAFKQRMAANLEKWDSDVLRHLGAFTDSDKADLVCALMTERPLSSSLEKSREGFLISSLYAMRHAMAQSTQTDTIGFRLDLYEDFCDGACFDKSDDMLWQQFKGHTCLTSAKKRAGVSGWQAFCHAPSTLSHRLWFTLVTRRVSAGVGKAVRTLNQTYKTDRFNAQVLLWPGEEDAEWLKSIDEVKPKLLALRRQILRSALGDTHDNAKRVLDRMWGPGVLQAQDLRMRFDYEYCDRSLDTLSPDTNEPVTDHAMADLESMSCGEQALSRKKAYLERSIASMSQFAAYLRDGAHAFVLDDAEALRAVKIMFHTNHRSIQKLFQTDTTEETQKLVDSLIQEAAGDKARYTRWLIAIRMHHQLTQLQHLEYASLVKTLAY
ncbi:MAG: hypothetical protein GY809_25965 [Planctomycetes bacterium]|nr:hypothetical protein [Planctomycetota bacterium]